MALTRTVLGSSTSESGASTTLAVTGMDSTSWTHILVFVKSEGTPGTITCADNKGSGAYNGLTLHSRSGGSLHGRLLWVKIGTPGASHDVTVTFGTAVDARRMFVYGINASSGEIELDVESTADGSGTAIDAGSLVTTTATLSFTASCGWDAPTYTPGSGWTEDFDTKIHGQSRTDTSGTLDPVCTSGTSMTWLACAASFKEVAGGGAQFTQGIAGALASSGAMLKQARVLPAGVLASAGALARQTRRTVAGLMASAGVVSAVKTFLKSLSGMLSASGVVTRHVRRVISGALASSGAAFKRVTVFVAGMVAGSGVASAVKTFLKALSGSLGTSGIVTRRPGKAVGGAMVANGVLTKRIGIGVAGLVALVGQMTKRIAVLRAGVLAIVGALTAAPLTGLATHVRLSHAIALSAPTLTNVTVRR